jgi:hypothetical protein
MWVNGRVAVGGGQVVELPALLDHPLDHPDDPTGLLLDPSGSMQLT